MKKRYNKGRSGSGAQRFRPSADAVGGAAEGVTAGDTGAVEETGDGEQSPSGRPAAAALPAEFVTSTHSMMGNGLYYSFVRALADEPPVSIRINSSKTTAVPRDADGGGRVPWCDDGYYLPVRPDFTFDPLLHAGHYYVQEASSMFVHRVISQYVTSPVLMLDLCAAPGGKSTAALGALPAGSMLMTNEPVRQRAQILKENIQKWGCPDVIVTNNYPRDYARSGLTFDVILCDVPCSGEGMFRKDSGAIGEWSPQNVDSCSRLQREIVADAWRCLRPGGLMIYSTCTFNTAENEENVRWACAELGATVLPVYTSDAWGISGSLLPGFTEPVYRFIPGSTRGEGLFCAVMRKGADDNFIINDCAAGSGVAKRPLAVSQKIGKKVGARGNDAGGRLRAMVAASLGRPEEAAGILPETFRFVMAGSAASSSSSEKSFPASGKSSSSFSGKSSSASGKSFSSFGKSSSSFSEKSSSDIILALPPALVPVYDIASRSLRILSAGVTVGQTKGRDIIPDQSLALSTALMPGAFPFADLTYAQAVAYLRKEAVTLPPDTPRGLVIVKYRGAPLGFVKNIGTRANNLYPPEWKIKSTHVPDEPHVLE